MRLAGLRGDVAFVSSEFRLSERTACKLLEMERSSSRYEPRPDRNAVTHILTLNQPDFVRYSKVNVIHPSQVQP